MTMNITVGLKILGDNSTKTISTSTVYYDNLLNTLFRFIGVSLEDDTAKLNAIEFDNFTANFKEVLPPIPAEY